MSTGPTELYDSIIEGKHEVARRLTQEALNGGTDPQELLNKSMVPAMDEVGRRFDRNEFFVPELLLAARAMKAGMELIRPLLAAGGTEPVARVVIGSVKGDLHDIGKNLVAAMLEGGGFEVFDLGVNVSPERFVSAAQEKKAQIVGLSALLTTTMASMKKTIDAFREAGLRDRVKILVGGAPVTERFAKEIGADGYSLNAPGAVSVAKNALSGVPFKN
jgi:5-methyltetrahydrofolate--homocysteine methyltransferase